MSIVDPTGVEMIQAERARQITEERWSAEHDDTHADDEMSRAACCYAKPGPKRADHIPEPWPWGAAAWKPNGSSTEGRIRDLTKAGALIAAEIDRLQRTL